MMFTDAVAALQEADGTREKYPVAYQHRRQDSLSDDDKAFIAQRESFYIASVNSNGWPYIQHRGGPRGLVKIIGDNMLACADYRGNRQYISMGNLQTNGRVSVFFMDYLNKARLKVQGEARLVAVKDADPDLIAQVQNPDLPVERVLTIKVIAMDWNCPKYIPDFFPKEIVTQVVSQKMGELTQENEKLRAEIAALKGA